MRNIILLSFLFTFVGCASKPAQDPKQLEAGLDQTSQMCDERIAKARQDLADTKARLGLLAQTHAPAVTGQVQTEIAKRVADLEQTLEKTKPARAQLLHAKSEIAALVYNRTELKSDDPNTPKVDARLRKFYAANDAIQKSVSDYLMKSSDLDEYMHNEKLYRTFHPADFQSEVRARIESAQEEARQMQTDLENARRPAENRRTPASSALAEMQDCAEKYVDHANRLAILTKEMTFATADAKQISNLDSGWDKAQKLRVDFSNLSAELDKLSGGFQAAKAKL